MKTQSNNKWLASAASAAAMLSIFSLAAEVAAQTNTTPAARQHVRLVNGTPLKYTSKLTKIVELNFTMGNGHLPGKQVIATALDRIASTYSTSGSPITVQHFTGANTGSQGGSIPNFTVTDLLSGQVIVANNISMFGDASLGTQRQTAIQQAIETEGRGYIGLHGSGDNERSGWAWFTNTLHPVTYQGHGDRTLAPVYKHLEQSKHLVLQGILETRTTVAPNVPDELDASGNEKLATNIPIRQMKNEWYRFGRDISRDPAYQSKVVPLLKYDSRNLGTNSLPAQYKRKGGNILTYIYTVGKGKTSYLPPGHENDELLDPNSGFDGGSGDFDRYMAQMMFYLAGYNTSACDASCNGLKVVDDKDQITDQTVTTIGSKTVIGVFKSDVYFYTNQVAFSSAKDEPYVAVVSDLSGRIMDQISGKGAVNHVFDDKKFKSGVFFLKVKVGKQAAQVKRYAFM